MVRDDDFNTPMDVDDAVIPQQSGRQDQACGLDRQGQATIVDDSKTHRHDEQYDTSAGTVKTTVNGTADSLTTTKEEG